MQITHRFSWNPTPSQLNQLQQLGIEGDLSFGILKVDDSNPLCPTLRNLFREWKAWDLITIKFTKHELDEANYLMMGAIWENGYPLPDRNFGYLNITYDLTDYDEETGIGARQIAPFHIKQEPKWGSRHAFTLNWVFDAFFVRPEVWHDVFRPFGIDCWPVIHHRSGNTLKTVVQLKVPSLAPSRLLLPDDAPTEPCPPPVEKKYHHPGIWCCGLMPAFERTPTEPIVMSREYFGSGGQAFRLAFVSSDLYHAIDEAKIKGFDFHPVTNSSG